MTNKERLEANNAKIEKIQENLNNKILSVNKEYIDLAQQMVDGTLEEFDNTKIGAKSLIQRRFYTFDKLKSANFTGITVITDYACHNCTNLENLILDPKTTRIIEYAFYQCPITDFVLDLTETCEVGQNAFYGTKIKSVRGKFSKIDKQAFYGLANRESLKEIDILLNGSFGEGAFQQQYYVEKINISKDSVITALPQNCFYSVGARRPNPETNILELDFSNSIFVTIGPYAFAGSSTYPTKYCNIIFPETVTSIGNYAFRISDHMNLYFRSLTPPTLSSNSFQNATNLKLCVPYNLLNKYKTATNWATYADNIVGFADKDSFTQGQHFPQYSLEGYTLTWYSDKELTQQVTIVENPNEYYYCTISGEQIEVVGFTSSYEENCKIVVANSSTGYEYVVNEGIPVGTQLTISATPTTTGYVPYIQTFNGEYFTGTYTYTTIGDTNINLTSVYYDGVNLPIRKDFAQNHWVIIKDTIQKGIANQYWQVGDVKTIKIEGKSYAIRLADLQTSRYSYSSGTKNTNAVLEFVDAFSSNSNFTKMNQTNTNAGGWAECELRTTINTVYLDKMPPELAYLLEDINITAANGGATNYTEIAISNDKLFLPCAEELNSVWEYYGYGTPGEGTVWDYYVGANNAKRIKYQSGGTVATYWWTRSTVMKSTGSFVSIDSAGQGYGSRAQDYHAITPCFAW